MDIEKILSFLHIQDFTRNNPALKPIFDVVTKELEDLAAQAAQHLADRLKAASTADVAPQKMVDEEQAPPTEAPVTLADTRRV